jgi:hypothetical protein
MEELVLKGRLVKGDPSEILEIQGAVEKLG